MNAIDDGFAVDNNGYEADPDETVFNNVPLVELESSHYVDGNHDAACVTGDSFDDDNIVMFLNRMVTVILNQMTISLILMK